MSDLLVRFNREKERGRIANTCLFLSNSKLAARAAAISIARELLECAGSPLVHPDCDIFDPNELGIKGLKVEHIATRKEGVKSVASCLRFRATEGGARVILIIQVETMGADAQAALLKTTEEPPVGTYLLLSASSTANILPALLSRCRIYRTHGISSAEAKQIAAGSGVDDFTWTVLLKACGSADAVLELSMDDRNQLLELHPEVMNWLENPAQGLEWLKMPEGGKLAEQRQDLLKQLSAALGWMSHSYLDFPTDSQFHMDRFIEAFSNSIGEVAGQITPQLVIERLKLKLDFSQ